MLMLLFRVGGDPWAIAAADIKDLVPAVTLQSFSPVAQQAGNGEHPEQVRFAGLLNYHGDRIPVIDVSALLGHPSAAPIMSTRIAIIESADKTEMLGLILEQAHETADLQEKITLPMLQAYVQEILKGPGDQVIRRLALPPLLCATYLPQPDTFRQSLGAL